MSIQQINENIENNIQGRSGADDVLRALEVITRMPVTFMRMVEAGTFLSTHHYNMDCWDRGCDDCYSEDTEFENGYILKDVSITLFENIKTCEWEEGGDDAEEEDDAESSELDEKLNVMAATEIKVEQLPVVPGTK